MDSRRERWLDEAAGPIVRPYAMTRGRTMPQGVRLDLITILVATGHLPTDQMRVSPEQRRLLGVAKRPSTVADLASEMDLPLGVIRVLLGDLLHQGLLAVHHQQPSSTGPRFGTGALGADPLGGDPLGGGPLAADPLGGGGPLGGGPLTADPLGAAPNRPDRRLLTRVLNDLRAL